jgi:hypothetical protein
VRPRTAHFDRYWLSAREMQDRFAATGFTLVFQGSTPPEKAEPAYGYMLVRRAVASLDSSPGEREV